MSNGYEKKLKINHFINKKGIQARSIDLFFILSFSIHFKKKHKLSLNNLSFINFNKILNKIFIYYEFLVIFWYLNM